MWIEDARGAVRDLQVRKIPMKLIHRREVLCALAGGASALWLGGKLRASGSDARMKTRMGIVQYALGIHRRRGWAGRHRGLSPAIALLEEARLLGAGGIQCTLSAADAPDIRRRAEKYGMHIEGVISPPRDRNDVERFERDVRVAGEAGAGVARTVIIPGRRYERFQSLDEFREFERRGQRSLELADPVLARHRFHLAVENHKDQRTWEKLALLKRISSEHIGLCVDVGNNFPLMEDPLATARDFAPWALTVHLKDQAVREYDEGYLLADVALGDGFLDLPAIVKVLREAKPGIKFNFETITRDPIPVPILTRGFWSTMQDTPAVELARTLRILKTRAHPEPFAEISAMSEQKQLAAEQQNVEQSIRHAAARLDI